MKTKWLNKIKFMKRPDKCICRNMKNDGMDGNLVRHRSESRDGFVLKELYGRWWIEEDKFAGKGVEINYCPFCGRVLNWWE